MEIKFKSAIIFSAAYIAGAASMLAYLYFPQESNVAPSVDYNGDGVMDEIYEDVGGGVGSKVNIDRNFDGRIDYVVEYDGNLPKTSIMDNDFNGVFDVHTVYVNGSPSVSRFDSDGDGVVDSEESYSHGVISEARFSVRQGLQYVISYRVGRPVKVVFENKETGKSVGYLFDKYAEDVAGGAGGS